MTAPSIASRHLPTQDCYTCYNQPSNNNSNSLFKQNIGTLPSSITSDEQEQELYQQHLGDDLDVDISQGECINIVVEGNSDMAKELFEIELKQEESQSREKQRKQSTASAYSSLITYKTHVIRDLVRMLPIYQLDLCAKLKPGAIISAALFSVQYQRMKLETSLRNCSSYANRRKTALQKPHPLRERLQ